MLRLDILAPTFATKTRGQLIEDKHHENKSMDATLGTVRLEIIALYYANSTTLLVHYVRHCVAPGTNGGGSGYLYGCRMLGE
jgi:hypothetical protein